MATPLDITGVLGTAALTPASAGNRSENATARGLSELIAADKYLRARAAADASDANNNPFGAMHFVQVELPGGRR